MPRRCSHLRTGARRSRPPRPQAQAAAFVDRCERGVAGADIVFIAVGTPVCVSDGHADLSQVHMAVEGFASFLKPGTIVVTKSTVPVGTGEIVEHLNHSIRPDLEFPVASNPEFLRAGRAVEHFLPPDRVVIGGESDFAAARLMKLYRSIGIEARAHSADRPSFVRTDQVRRQWISRDKNCFINEVADNCEKVDARIGDVTRGIGQEERIGGRYLQPDPGFGGSCFPKDARAR
jgi:UDPglucose 6-dehydrogenase